MSMFPTDSKVKLICLKVAVNSTDEFHQLAVLTLLSIRGFGKAVIYTIVTC
jgi:hypothetical protein